jgi:hypothetical protein
LPATCVGSIKGCLNGGSLTGWDDLSADERAP